MAQPIKRDRDDEVEWLGREACTRCGGIGYLIRPARKVTEVHTEFEYERCPRCAGSGSEPGKGR